MENLSKTYVSFATKDAPSKWLKARDMRKKPTEAERILWSILRANKFQNIHFRRQQIIEGFIVDFYCHRYHLMIEVDGEIHDKQPESDQERNQVLKSQGLDVLRFTNDQVKYDLRSVLCKIGERILSLHMAQSVP